MTATSQSPAVSSHPSLRRLGRARRCVLLGVGFASVLALGGCVFYGHEYHHGYGGDHDYHHQY